VPSVAKKYAGRWIAISHDNPEFAKAAQDVTFDSAVQDMALAGIPHMVSPTTIAGVPVVGLASTTTSSRGEMVETLYARAKGSPLPVQEILRTGNEWSVLTISHWHEGVHVTAPKHSARITTVVAPPPPPGPAA
jgi:hypothetical protein